MCCLHLQVMAEKTSSQIEWLITGMTCHLLLSVHLPWTALKED